VAPAIQRDIGWLEVSSMTKYLDTWSSLRQM